jgi:nucleolar complex protein 3
VSKRANSSDAASKRLGLVAVRCLCDLLTSLPHFNFATNVMHAVVRLALRSKGPEPRGSCCVAVRRLFERDQQGQVSLEGARLICREVKARKLVVHEAVVRTLLALKLRVREDEAEQVKARAEQDARGRKRRRRDGEEGEEEDDEETKEERRKDIMAGLKEAEARADPLVKARCQAEALQVRGAQAHRAPFPASRRADATASPHGLRLRPAHQLLCVCANPALLSLPSIHSPHRR